MAMMFSLEPPLYQVVLLEALCTVVEFARVVRPLEHVLGKRKNAPLPDAVTESSLELGKVETIVQSIEKGVGLS